MDAVASALMAITDVFPECHFRRCGWNYYEIRKLIAKRMAGPVAVGPEVLFIALNPSNGSPHHLPKVVQQVLRNVRHAQAAQQARVLVVDTTVAGRWTLEDVLQPLAPSIEAGDVTVFLLESNVKQATMGLGTAMSGTLALLRAQAHTGSHAADDADRPPPCQLHQRFQERTAPCRNIARPDNQLVAHILTHAGDTKHQLTRLAAANAALAATFLPAMDDELPYQTGTIFMQRHGSAVTGHWKQRGIPRRDSFGWPGATSADIGYAKGALRICAGWLSGQREVAAAFHGLGKRRKVGTESYDAAYVRAAARQALQEALSALPAAIAAAQTTATAVPRTTADHLNVSWEALAQAVVTQPQAVNESLVIPKIASLLKEAFIPNLDPSTMAPELRTLAHHLLLHAGAQGRAMLPHHDLRLCMEMVSRGPMDGSTSAPGWTQEELAALSESLLPSAYWIPIR